MPQALVGAECCRRCGYFRPAGAAVTACAECGAGWLPAVPSSANAVAGLFAGVVRASRRRRYAARAIDLIVPLALVAVTVLIWRSPAPSADRWPPAVAALLFLLAELTALVISGRTPGRLLLRLRTVDDLTGTPIGLRRLARRFTGVKTRSRLLTADLSRGRDPQRPQLVPAVLSIFAGADQLGRFGAASGSHGPHQGLDWSVPVAIVLDSGERYPLIRPVVVGRRPEEPGSGAYELLALPDMSRRLAKTHLLLERSETMVWATDLDSATGTAIVTPDGVRTPLATEVRTGLDIDSIIECGGRRLMVTIDG